MTIEHADLARGARVEIAINAATKGDVATAAGILAGMSQPERDEFGPLIVAMFPIAMPGRAFGAMSYAGKREAT